MNKEYTNTELCYIALSHLEELSNKKKAAVLELFKSAEDCLLNLSSKAAQVADIITRTSYDKLLTYQTKTYLEKFIKALNEQGIVAVTRKSELYPSNMMNLDDPPLVLYCKGKVELLGKRSIGIVGTRDCTRYGTEVAKRFGKALAEHDIVVVSGLADGIDAAAHHGACSVACLQGEQQGFNTVAVLGNGVNVYYPQSNAALQKQIGENGLLVSEYLPNTKSDRHHFPLRNRIIAALSSAVIIVEADIKSGALITKNYALDLGIDVYAVPGPITSYASRGTNAIIKTAACAMITDIADILDIFSITVKGREEHTVTQISFEAKAVLDAIGKNNDAHFDEIAIATNFSPKKLISLLTNMELDGLILKLSGNYYAAKQR